MSFRKEKKYRLTISDFHKISDQLFQQGMKPLFNPRIINSVYFDTVDLNMFHESEEGVLPRKKIRIRWYDYIKGYNLETKISSIEGRFKITSRVESDISENSICTNNRDDPDYGRIWPTLKVSYERSYFQFNKMRLTFDKNISYQNLTHLNRQRHFDPERVVEIKLDSGCSDDFVEKFFPYASARFSKYSRGLLLSVGALSEI